jgi:TatD DNase family protein
MVLTDTHTHLYLDAFDHDRSEVVERSLAQDVRYMLLPNIDHASIDPMLALCDAYPENCHPMLGLHPTSVNADFEEELEAILSRYVPGRFLAIGEIGIDLYWDKTFFEQQKQAFRRQIEFAQEKGLPIVIHSRDSFLEIVAVLSDYKNSGLKGVFHCFTGTTEEAAQAIELGFMLGIGGVLTFKNSGLDKVIREVALEHLILETDSPFLAPVPFRGKRNESAYISIIASRLADIKHVSRETVAEATTRNAMRLFNFTSHE